MEQGGEGPDHVCQRRTGMPACPLLAAHWLLPLLGAAKAQSHTLYVYCHSPRHLQVLLLAGRWLSHHKQLPSRLLHYFFTTAFSILQIFATLTVLVATLVEDGARILRLPRHLCNLLVLHTSAAGSEGGCSGISILRSCRASSVSWICGDGLPFDCRSLNVNSCRMTVLHVAAGVHM
jgi:hypothetical protein